MSKSLADLSPNERDLLLASLAWSERFWDEQMGLLWAPGDRPDPQGDIERRAHTVRDSAWYALGLLLRNDGGDTARAVRILHRILDYQFDEPGQVYHGTFYRSPQEAHPPEPALEWKHYDPNWREFIMTTYAAILIEYEARLPRPLVERIDAAFVRAVDGALARGLKASYTNIALMHVFMLCYAGRRLRRPDWEQAGESMAAEVHRLFTLHNTFDEYNSPTYYGADLYALALWRRYGTSHSLRSLGAEMEALLWTDIARYYHAGLRNLAGPYDRSYGMDMRRYAAVVGMWFWLATGRDLAPFPRPHERFAHAHDFLFAPPAALLGAVVPDAALPHLLAFQGERQVEQVIADEPRRVATAWLGRDVIIGAEHAGGSRSGAIQYHPATMHWRVGGDDVGWLRLVHNEPVDARAGANRLQIEGSGEIAFQVCAAGAHARDITGTLWQLPGLTVTVSGGGQEIRVEDTGEWLVVRYPAEQGKRLNMKLDVAPTGGHGKDPSDIRFAGDIAFADVRNNEGKPERLLLDLYLPGASHAAPHPAIMWFHGGGFAPGNDRRQVYIPMFARAFAARGYIGIAPDYRVRANPHADFPGTIGDAVADGRRALDWVRTNAAAYGWDGRRLVLAGGSAGGMLVLSMCHDAAQSIDATRDGVQAIFDMWGSPARQWRTFDHVHAGSPPTLLIHGTADALVPYANSVALAKELTEAGIPNRLLTLPDAPHTPLKHFDQIVAAMVEFLKQHLDT